MFADLDETIRQLLIRQVPLDPNEVEISFEAPDREWSGRLSRPAINLFLYDVRENRDFRETDWAMQARNGAATIRKAPLRINVTYQVSVWARAPEDEHRLLWRVLAVLARHQVLPPEMLQGELREQPFPIPAKVAQPEHVPQNYADLWQALENRIHPSLPYVVTLALDPEVVFTSPLVFTRVARLQTLDGQPVAESYQIGGRVRARGDPARGIAGATVVLRESGVEATTDAAGRFIFARAPQGRVTFVVRVPGQPEVTVTAEVPAPSYDLEV